MVSPNASPESATEPGRPSPWQRLTASLQGRMLLVYFLVGLLPMFLAAELASQVVTYAFERNLRTWLHETGTYFLASLTDFQHEASGMSAALAAQPEIMSKLVDGDHRLPELVGHMLSGEGFDLLQIRDAQQQVVFSSIPVQYKQTVQMGRNLTLIRVQTGDDDQLMMVGTSPFELKGRRYELLLGSWLDANFFSHISDITSFDFRLFTPAPDQSGRYIQFFRSKPGTDEQIYLRSKVERALLSGENDYFARHSDSGNYAGLYLPIRSDDGKLQGVAFCGLHFSFESTRWISRTSVFLIIFLTGTILSIIIGYSISRYLTGPLRSLAASVRAITDGHYASRVRVQGEDEVAELAQSFNAMAARLEHLNQLEKQLRQRDRLLALGEAAAGIAHEVRNPLGVICTSAELIRNRNALSERDVRLIDNVISEVRRIDRLIGDFLAYAKTRPLRLAPLPAAELVAQVAQVCAPELSRRGIRLEIDNQVGAQLIEADADELHQAILNVLLNACEAMPNGGTLTIRLQRSDGQLLIGFRDSGGGIDPALIERIFDPFVTTKASGTGLGLAKTRAIIESHGGRVECRNLAGGAEFEFTIPLPAVALS